jgi:hypothetical protein
VWKREAGTKKEWDRQRRKTERIEKKTKEEKNDRIHTFEKQQGRKKGNIDKEW